MTKEEAIEIISLRRAKGIKEINEAIAPEWKDDAIRMVESATSYAIFTAIFKEEQDLALDMKMRGY